MHILVGAGEFDRVAALRDIGLEDDGVAGEFGLVADERDDLFGAAR